jgi:hypothetical protein
VLPDCLVAVLVAVLVVVLVVVLVAVYQCRFTEGRGDWWYIYYEGKHTQTACASEKGTHDAGEIGAEVE